MTSHISGPVGPTDSRGQPYLTMVGGSIKREGDPIDPKEVRADEAEAWGVFLEGFYRNTHDMDVVEWRRLPMLETHGGTDRIVVYARFSAYRTPAGAEAVRDALNNGWS